LITNIDWNTTQRIEVTNEDDSKSILETGLTTLYKPEYFQEHLDYLYRCNPTKTFTLINSNS